MPNYDTQKLLRVKGDIENYLEKHDPMYREQRNTVDNLNKTILELKSFSRRFSESLDRLTTSINQSLVTSVGNIIASINSKDTQLFVKELGKQDSELGNKLIESLDKTRETFSSFKFPVIPKVPSSIALPDVQVLKNQLSSVEKAIQNIPKPKDIVIPSEVSMREARQLYDSIKFVEKAVISLPLLLPKEKQVKIDTSPIVEAINKLKEKIEKIKMPEMDFPRSIEISNFPPQRVAVPQNNVWINPLQGFIETTSVTIGTSIVKLPDYGQLFNRRAVIIYNNSANTIFIGGSEVTTSNGLPVPKSSYSPVLDAGNTLVVYGVASQAGNNVRVLEISKDKSDTVQQ